MIYAFAVELATKGYGPLNLGITESIVISGVVGAILVGLIMKLVAPLQTAWKFWVLTTLAGLFGGFVFSLLGESSHYFITVIAYGAWQIPVCLALHFGRE